MSKAKIYTLDELQAMTDTELAELAARLLPASDIQWNGRFPSWKPRGAKLWKPLNPAADIGQAHGLLDYGSRAANISIIQYRLSNGEQFIDLENRHPPIDPVSYMPIGWLRKRVPGNDARAMTCAFILAKQAG